MPAENLTIEETLRVLDVAREMRDQRQTAEEMFRRDNARQTLREKLMRSARIAGEKVSEAELDAAIDQYLATQHTYQDPPLGLQSLLAHCWVRRQEIIWGLAALGASLGGIWYFFA